MSTQENNQNLVEVMEAARKEIESNGWLITETPGDGETIHVVCEKNGERRAWGMFDAFTCYSEAYRVICGKDIVSLKR